MIIKMVNQARTDHKSPGAIRKELSRLKKEGYIRSQGSKGRSVYFLNGEHGRKLAINYLERGGTLRVTPSPSPPAISVHRRYMRLRTKLTRDRLQWLRDNDLISKPKEGDRAKTVKLETANITAIISESTGTAMLYSKTDDWQKDTLAYLGEPIASEAKKRPFKQHAAISKEDLSRFYYEDDRIRMVEDGSTFPGGEIEAHGDEKDTIEALEMFLMDRRDGLSMFKEITRQMEKIESHMKNNNKVWELVMDLLSKQTEASTKNTKALLKLVQVVTGKKDDQQEDPVDPTPFDEDSYMYM